MRALRLVTSLPSGKRILVSLFIISALILWESPACLAYSSWSSVPSDYRASPIPDAHVEKRAVTVGVLTFYTLQTEFENYAPGLPSEDFSGSNVPTPGICIDVGPLNSSTNDPCFSTGGVIDGFSLGVSGPSGTNQYVILTTGQLGAPFNSVGPNNFVDDMELTFSPTVTAVGFDVVGNVVGPVNVNLQIFGPGNILLGTSTVAGTAAGTFWGVTSSNPIERISFVEPGGNGELIGNLQFGAARVVPTMNLNQYGLLILALAMVGSALWIMRRKKLTA